MKEFMATWTHFYRDCVPISYFLKHAEPDRWLRFHYVPAWQRDLSRADEISAALNVMNTAASAVLGDASDCWVSAELYARNDLAYAAHAAVIAQLDMTKAGRIEVTGDERKANIYAAKTTWEPHRRDVILRQIANDEVRLMWMNAATGAVFAPYDRGVDLILPSVSDVSRLAHAHSDWLSSYPGGW